MNENEPAANELRHGDGGGDDRYAGETAAARALPAGSTGNASIAGVTSAVADWARSLPTGIKRIGIIVPYRDRLEHLQRFIPHLISYFHRDPTASRFLPIIVISEQSPGAPFNRGAVLNAGFLAVERIVDFVCFHDVDFLPIDADYSPVERPTRVIWHGMSVRPVRVADQSRIVKAPRVGLGAVTVCGNADFRAANGFSNRYFGWGFEDIDLMERFRLCGIEIGQKDGRFEALDHDHAGFADDGRPNAAWIANEARFQAAKAAYEREGMKHDGLTSFPYRLALETCETAHGIEAGETAEILRVVTDIPGPRARLGAPKENLVIVRCGSQSLHPSWLGLAAERSWDLFLCPYEPVATTAPEDGAVFGDVIKGPKWAGLSVGLRANFGGAVDWRNYRHIWFPDDDLAMRQGDINRLFEMAAQLRARLCSPALDPASHFSHLITMQNTEFIARRTTFVEIMMPCFATETLATLMATIDRSTTGYGWGLDFVWPQMLGFDDVYVIDAVTVLHTRPVHAAPQAVYDDMTHVLTEAGAQPRRAVLGGYDGSSAYMADGDLAFRAKLIRGWAYLYARWPQLLQRTFTDQGW